MSCPRPPWRTMLPCLAAGEHSSRPCHHMQLSRSNRAGTPSPPTKAPNAPRAARQGPWQTSPSLPSPRQPLRSLPRHPESRVPALGRGEGPLGAVPPTPPPVVFSQGCWLQGSAPLPPDSHLSVHPRVTPVIDLCAERAPQLPKRAQPPRATPQSTG